MKLKAWLNTYKQMTYGKYCALTEYEQFDILAEHQAFCRKEQLRQKAKSAQRTLEHIQKFIYTRLLIYEVLH